MVQTTLKVPALVNLREKVTLVAVFDLKPGPETLWGTLPLQDQPYVAPVAGGIGETTDRQGAFTTKNHAPATAPERHPPPASGGRPVAVGS
jgi:hypothetical protein